MDNKGHAWAADLQHDLEELSLLSHVFSRTKKRDVFPNATMRTARVISVALTPAEGEFYDAVTEFVRDNAPNDTGAIKYFAIMAAQRQAASCMPATRDRFIGRATWKLEDELDAEVHDLEEIAQSFAIKISQKVIDAARGLGNADTKYDQLLRILARLDDEEPGRKIILFAYYKATLHYLKDRLDRDGIACELIHGGIKSDPRRPDRDERGKRMRRFREDPDVRLLLSSEVGSEGLDFQFCHIIINYDLPWNPMRVEQRIGRVDRLGQESDRILIFNFTLKDTIEDRVLNRLYRRIGIFERTLGDLEAIVGEEIGRLTRQLLSSRLTPEEESIRIEQSARAIENRRRELEKLEAEADRLVSGDGYFEDELNRIMRGGELLGASDREAFVLGFLERAHPRVQLGPARRKGVRTLRVTQEFDVATRQLPPSAARQHFLQKALSRRVPVTFDSQIAFDHPDTEFLAAHHPVVQLAVQYYRGNREQLHPVWSLRLRQSQNVAAGAYLFLLFAVRIEAGASRFSFPSTIALDDGRFLFGVEAENHETRTVFRSLKRKLITPNGDVRDIDASDVAPDPQDLGAHPHFLVAVYLSAVLHRVRELAAEEHGADSEFLYNLDIPVSKLDGGLIQRGYQTALDAAVDFAETDDLQLEDYPTLWEHWIEVLNRESTGSPDREHKRWELIPESSAIVKGAEAALASILQNSRRYIAIADIGAGTTDLGWFRWIATEEEDRVVFFSAKTSLVGCDDVDQRLLDILAVSNTDKPLLLPAVREAKPELQADRQEVGIGNGYRPLSPADLDQAADKVAGHSFDAYSVSFGEAYRKEKNTDRWQDIRVILVGGGSQLDGFRSRFERHPRSFGRYVDLRVPGSSTSVGSAITQLGAMGSSSLPPRDADIVFLLPALGLSNPPIEIPDPTLPEDVAPLEQQPGGPTGIYDYEAPDDD